MSCVEGTPLPVYGLRGRQITVKREDLSCPFPGPSFSKARGVFEHVANRPESTIGVLDTYHSKGGWAVAWACRELGKTCVDFHPVYKHEPGLRPQQLKCEDFGAILSALPAGRSAVLYHQAKKELAKLSDSYMMPNALKLPESVDQTAAEVVRTFRHRPKFHPDHVVISISSGTIAAGVLKGLYQAKRLPKCIWLHEGYSRSREAVTRYINQMAGGEPILDWFPHVIIDEGYAYKDECYASCPFPSNPHYDLKAWAWLGSNLDSMNGTVLFWNIGD